MTQQIVFEGDVKLEYSAGDTDREIIITEPPTPETMTADVVTGGYQPEALANYIARQLGFPSNAEFDEMLQKIRAQQASGTYNCEERDATREGVRLRVTVEVLNPGIGIQQ
jgi:hypothetical protein